MLLLTGVCDRICVIRSCYSENMRQWTSAFSRSYLSSCAFRLEAHRQFRYRTPYKIFNIAISSTISSVFEPQLSDISHLSGDLLDLLLSEIYAAIHNFMGKETKSQLGNAKSEWFGSEGTLTIKQFKHSCHGQG